MKSSTKDTAKGKAHEVKGKVKEKIGKATNNPNVVARGSGRESKWEGSKETRASRKSLRRLVGA